MRFYLLWIYDIIERGLNKIFPGLSPLQFLIVASASLMIINLLGGLAMWAAFVAAFACLFYSLFINSSIQLGYKITLIILCIGWIWYMILKGI